MGESENLMGKVKLEGKKVKVNGTETQYLVNSSSATFALWPSLYLTYVHIGLKSLKEKKSEEARARV